MNDPVGYGSVDESANEPGRYGAVVAEATRLKKIYVDEEIAWYEKHGRKSRIWFRAIGFCTIMLSSSLPAVAAVDEKFLQYKTVILSTMSIAIASATALGSFFNWDKNWKGLLTTQMTLEQARGKWEVEMLKAAFVSPPEERIEYVHTITAALLAEVRRAMQSETQRFFKEVKPPQNNETRRQ